MDAAPGYSIADLQNLKPTDAYYELTSDSTNLRLKAISQAAEELGIQTALAQESQVIDVVLNSHASQLDQVFNFRLLMYKDNVLPPVIVMANHVARLSENGESLRIGGQTYRVISQVRFVTTPPTWRDYLWMGYPYPEYPDRSLLPKNKAERAVWAAALQKGLQEGTDQALSIYQLNLDRLKRDFTGMVLYRKLLTEQMVSPFDIRKERYGVTGDGTHMTIDDQDWIISVKPELQVRSQLWQPVLVSEPATNGRTPEIGSGS